MLKPIVAAACLSAVMATAPAEAASIVDGSFETPHVFSLAQNPTANFRGQTGLYRDGILGGVVDGTQAAFLRSLEENGRDQISNIRLNIIDLVPGVMYTLSYFGAQLSEEGLFYGGVINFESDDGSFSRQSLGSFRFLSTEYTQFQTRSFTAQSTNGHVTFSAELIASLAGGSALSGIDAITINQVMAGGVPEPATWAMLIVGFGLVGAVARRRRNGFAAALA